VAIKPLQTFRISPVLTRYRLFKKKLKQSIRTWHVPALFQWHINVWYEHDSHNSINASEVGICVCERD